MLSCARQHRRRGRRGARRRQPLAEDLVPRALALGRAARVGRVPERAVHRAGRGVGAEDSEHDRREAALARDELHGLHQEAADAAPLRRALDLDLVDVRDRRAALLLEAEVHKGERRARREGDGRGRGAAAGGRGRRRAALVRRRRDGEQEARVVVRELAPLALVAPAALPPGAGRVERRHVALGQLQGPVEGARGERARARVVPDLGGDAAARVAAEGGQRREEVGRGEEGLQGRLRGERARERLALRRLLFGLFGVGGLGLRGGGGGAGGRRSSGWAAWCDYN